LNLVRSITYTPQMQPTYFCAELERDAFQHLLG
jgi:hypothetical protein